MEGDGLRVEVETTDGREQTPSGMGSGVDLELYVDSDFASRDTNRRSEMGRGQLDAFKRTADAFVMMASGNSGVGAYTNRAGTVITGAEAVEKLRFLLEMRKDPSLLYVCSSSDFRDVLTVATRQQLTREDGEALASLTSEVNNDPTIDVEFSVPEVFPAILASRS